MILGFLVIYKEKGEDGDEDEELRVIYFKKEKKHAKDACKKNGFNEI